MKFLKLLVGFICLQIIVVPSLLILAISMAEPDKKGISPEIFKSPDNAVSSINTLIKVKQEKVTRPNIIVILADDLGMVISAYRAVGQ